LPIEVHVLDFTLSRSMLENNWYAQSMWGDRKVNTEERALFELHNLVNHGADYIGLFEHRKNLPEVLRLMRLAGMKTDKVYLTADGGDSSVSIQYTTPASAAEMAKEWLETAKGAGCNNVNMYLIDEARDDVLKGERPFAEAMRSAGVKTWVACYSNYFDTAGDFIDSANIANECSAMRIHRAVLRGRKLIAAIMGCFCGSMITTGRLTGAGTGSSGRM
jgi:hypothetical protein